MSLGRVYSDLQAAGYTWLAIVLIVAAYVFYGEVFDRVWIERSKVAQVADKIDVAAIRLKESLARYLNVTIR